MPTMPPEGCLSVVIPCFNEARTVTTVLERVLAQPCVGEVVVVDDGSTDGSPGRVATVKDARVRLLRQPRNLGKGAALRRGLALAACPYVIVQDADLEYDPAEYPVLLGPLVEGQADVVYGSRFLSGRAHRVLYFWHSMGNRFLTLASNMATDLNLTDMETGAKVFRREVLQSVVVEEDRFGFEPEITAKVARGGWRVYEVGISYAGRTYAEGKKIGWRDGVRALWCIGRYGLAARLESSPAGAPASPTDADAALGPTLEAMEGAENYAGWIHARLAPHLRGRILEVGAGRGTFTGRLAAHGPVVATEVSEAGLEALRQRYRDDPRVEVLHHEALPPSRRFDTAVLVNVLEHVEDDAGFLRQLADRLEPGGALVAWVPALPALMSDFDRAIGHHRRYTRPALATAAYRAGLEVLSADYVNSVGALAWWVVARGLGRAPTAGPATALYDAAVVPWLRQLEEKVAPPLGQSLLLVARRPG